MKRFYILITICLIFIVTANKIDSAEEIENSTTQNTISVYETAINENLEEGMSEEKEMTQAEWEQKEKEAAMKVLFKIKCNKCHSFKRPLSKKKTLSEWKETVERMQKKEPAWILPAEVITIIDYLFKINGIEKKEMERDTTWIK